MGWPLLLGMAHGRRHEPRCPTSYGDVDVAVRATRELSDFVRAELCQVADGSFGLLDELEVQMHVKDEAPLTIVQVRQVCNAAGPSRPRLIHARRAELTLGQEPRTRMGSLAPARNSNTLGTPAPRCP